MTQIEIKSARSPLLLENEVNIFCEENKIKTAQITIIYQKEERSIPDYRLDYWHAFITYEKEEVGPVLGVSLTHEGRVGNCWKCAKLLRQFDAYSYCPNCGCAILWPLY